MKDEKSCAIVDIQRVCVKRFKRSGGIRPLKMRFDSSLNKRGRVGGFYEEHKGGISLSLKKGP